MTQLAVGALQVTDPNEAAITEWLRLFVLPGQVTELRALNVKRRYGKPVTMSGYYEHDRLDVMVRDALSLTNKGHDSKPAPGVYFVINPVNPALLSRRTNRVDVAEHGALTTDADILTRRWLLIDVDPIRPAAISSSDEEKQHAQNVVLAVGQYLVNLRWPKPLVVDSGNGWHLYFRIDLPVDDGDLVKHVLHALANRFDTDRAKVDTSVFNPSRISKLPGTKSRKGDDTSDRPHRWSRSLNTPDEVGIVSREQLEALAAEYEAQLANKAGSPKGKGLRLNAKTVTTSSNGKSVIDRARSYLATMPPSISGQDGHGAAYNAACRLVKGFALSNDDAYPLLAEWNERCSPPWTESELRHKLDSAQSSNEEVGSLLVVSRSSRVWAGDPGDPDELLIDEYQTDAKLSERFARMYGENLKYIREWSSWIHWDGIRWSNANTGIEIEYARKFSELIWREKDRHEPKPDPITGETPKNPLDYLAKKVSTAKFMYDVTKLARCTADMSLSFTELDQRLDLLNVPSGTIELKTGLLRPHCREDYITSLCPVDYDPAATCPVWERSIYQMMKNDADLCHFLQTWFGYCATGEIKEQAFVIMHGSGSNGKSLMISTIMECLGELYTKRASSELLIESGNREHPTIKADLYGKRMVVCAETGDSSRLNETLIKDLTGEKEVTARRLYQNMWTFRATHKLILSTNHRPAIRGTDNGIWRRVILIPCNQKYWDPDKGESGPEEFRQNKSLGDEFKKEASGILNWIIAGAKNWYENGLHVPEIARIAAAEYRKSEDILQQFFEERCYFADDAQVTCSDLYRAVEDWRYRNGLKKMSSTKFGKIMSEIKNENGETKFPRYRDKHERHYIGIGLVDVIGRGSVLLNARGNGGEHQKTIDVFYQ